MRLSARTALLGFALVELGIGAFGAISGWLYYDVLFVRASWLYTPVWRAALVHLAVLLPPTFLMGMSLPLLARATVVDTRSAGRTLGLLYGINLLGAALGALLAPWWFIRFYGIRGATFAAAALNVFAGATGLAAGARAGREWPVRRSGPGGRERCRGRADVPLLDPPLRPQRVLRAVAGGGVVPRARRGAQVECLHVRHPPLRLPVRIGPGMPRHRAPRRPGGAPASRLPRPAVRAHRLRGPRRRAHRLAAFRHTPSALVPRVLGRLPARPRLRPEHRGRDAPPVCRPAPDPLRPAHVPDGRVLPSPAARRAGRSGDGGPQGRAPAGGEHRRLRRGQPAHRPRCPRPHRHARGPAHDPGRRTRVRHPGHAHRTAADGSRRRRRRC